MRLLEKEQIILEMCPTSNVQTKAVPALSEHPIRMFFDRGITRDRQHRQYDRLQHNAGFKEYALLKKQFHFTDQELAKMSQTALRGAFCKL